MRLTEDDYTRDILSTIRSLKESVKNPNKNLLKEDSHEKAHNNAIAITDEPKFGQNVLTNQIQQFRSIVESGAQFAKVEGNEVSECPLIYIPNTGNLIFSGTIPSLNNLKFQYVLKTSTGMGCFIWCDGTILSKDNILIINRLFNYYLNWREQWISESSDLERMANHIND